MYRCHFTKHGRVAQGENLAAATLDEAIEESRRLLADKPASDALDGFEIWEGPSLLYSGGRNTGGSP